MAYKSYPNSFGSIRANLPLAYPGEAIGIMGGTFNPPHEGHRIVAQTSLARLGLSRVWWLVTPGNPLKDHADLKDLSKRIASVSELANHPNFEVTAFESDLAAPYTATTLAFVKRRFPATRFVWLMGADNLASFHRWQHWQDIAATFPIAVVDRPGWHLPALSGRAAHLFARDRLPENRAKTLIYQKPPCWTFLSTRLSPLSSSALRLNSKA